MLRLGKHLGNLAAFDDLAVAHHADRAGVVLGQPQIVGDEDDGHAHLLLQVVQQVEDLGLDGHVERRGGLVGNQQIGVVDQRHRNHDALQLSARELVRILPHAAFRLADAHALQQLQHPPVGLGPVPVRVVQ